MVHYNLHLVATTIVFASVHGLVFKFVLTVAHRPALFDA